MSVLLGTLSAFFIGLGDLCVGRVLRAVHVVSLTTAASLGALGSGAIGLLIVRSEFIAADFAMGVLSGCFMGVGLVFYFKGMQSASVGIVAPISAVQLALWPLGYDVIRGARPSLLAWLGVVIAMVSLVLTTVSPELGNKVAAGVRSGVLAGSFYGIGIVVLSVTDPASGMWPAVAHRSSGVVVFAIAAVFLGLPSFPSPGQRWFSLLGGILGGFGLVAYLYGAQNYSLGVVAVTSAMFPAFSSFLLYRFGDHPLRWWQGIGIAGAVSGVALIALG